MYPSRFLVIVSLLLVVAAFRLFPHPPNFAPIGAMALFGGACLTDKRMAFLVPLAALLLSDLAIGLSSGDLSMGLHKLTPLVYGTFALIVCLGFWLRRHRRAIPIAAATLASSGLFFILTNFGVWMLGVGYAKTWEGLIACYAAAIPFFHNTLWGNAVYVMALFSGLALVEKSWPVLREPTLTPAQ